MRIKTSELTGAALDWAVAKCENADWSDEDCLVNVTTFDDYTGTICNYSTDWAQGGPIIERENITVRPVFHAERTEGGSDIYRQDGWSAHMTPKAFWVTPRAFAGSTPLIAAMRCYVASKLGDEVDVPEELCK